MTDPVNNQYTIKSSYSCGNLDSACFTDHPGADTGPAGKAYMPKPSAALMVAQRGNNNPEGGTGQRLGLGHRQR